MKIVKEIEDMKVLSATFRAQDKRIGLVPTMGALHEGHMTLLRTSRRLCDTSVMSIFVNPTQFGPGEDFEKYPRTFDSDCAMAENNGCDVVFSPTPAAMYPRSFATFIDVEGITKGLCGVSRPGHFRGVATVVMKFFNIVSPQIAIFGQKDAQQVVVLKRMVEDLNGPVTIIVEPIAREADGLAMSSRNRYLTDSERTQAPLLHEGLMAANRLYTIGERSTSRLLGAIRSVYGAATLLAPEYIEIVDTQTLEPLVHIESSALAMVAARTKESKTRLIDNAVLGGTL
jgi:pantoate--beta-alanine ligase